MLIPQPVLDWMKVSLKSSIKNNLIGECLASEWFLTFLPNAMWSECVDGYF